MRMPSLKEVINLSQAAQLINTKPESDPSDRDTVTLFPLWTHLKWSTYWNIEIKSNATRQWHWWLTHTLQESQNENHPQESLQRMDSPVQARIQVTWDKERRGAPQGRWSHTLRRGEVCFPQRRRGTRSGATLVQFHPDSHKVSTGTR